MPSWINEGFEDYTRRMPRDVPVELVELKSGRRAITSPIEQTLSEEGERILRAVPDGSELVALDERGESWTTVKFATQMKRLMERGRHLTFAIGSADGLAPKVKAAAQHLLSLSAFTLPHGLVRVLLAEQLYRAVSLMRNHPYHRE